MQRITWSGIALHGGVLPGRPASHGCIRLPFDFAERLFDATTMGMRVIVAPADVAPVEIAHPLLFQPKPGAAALAAARTAEAQEATKKAAEARVAAGTALREATQAKVPVRATENLKRRAEAQLAAVETRAWLRHLGGGKGAGRGRQGAGRRQNRRAAAAMGRRQCGSATEARCRHVCARRRRRRRDGARRGSRGGPPGRKRTAAGIGADQPQDPAALCPSGIQARARKSGHDRGSRSSNRHACLHRRRAHRPTTPSCDGTSSHWAADMRRVARLSQKTGRAGVAAATWSRRRRTRTAQRPRSTASPFRRTYWIASPALAPRSSLIVTDEPPSSETGKGTEFVVLLSGEPQGGIKRRRRSPASEFRYARPRSQPFWRSPFGGPFTAW